MFDRIIHNPDILCGRPVIRGMRISASLVANLAANGMPADEILREYPNLAHEDIKQAVAYVASNPIESKGE